MILMICFQRHLLILISVLVGLFPRNLFELFIEIGHRLETTRIADAVNVHLILFEELTRVLDTYFFEEV